MVAPTARPKRTAFSTAARFSTGSTPGSAMSTAHAWTLGAAPKSVAAPEKIFERVDNCACVSRPMTVSHCIFCLTSFGDSPRLRRTALPAGAVGQSQFDRPNVVNGAARRAHLGAVAEGHREAVLLVPHTRRA